ncbi:MAG: hypothetical protein M1817_004784 [Caeruleum heppii]|nr:MAG: hypothetical protein M1817_004784 [Caeruleum heppii]
MLADRLVNTDHLESPEDILCTSLNCLFTDDLQNQHGSPGCSITYRSPRFGDVELRLNDPIREADRLLFSHYVWNAALQLAALIEDGQQEWKVHGERVLELGAGSGLCGIVSYLAGANETVITDYPSDEILSNLLINIEENRNRHVNGQMSSMSANGHVWGDVESHFAMTHKNYFSLILAADCLWMQHEHVQLLRSMLWFLSLNDTASILVVAGFHTGRGVVARFFDHAEEQGLRLASIYEIDASGRRRGWAERREEDLGERKKWNVVASLRLKKG